MFRLIFFISLIVMVPINCLSSVHPFAASPDQVLVLYNAEWEKDVAGSMPGNDSKEVADYYVRMHTDPLTGKRPYILGLKCIHGKKHLNQWFIKEASQDNRNGIEYIGKGKGPRPNEIVRDSRYVEFEIKPEGEIVDWQTLKIECRPLAGGKRLPVSPIVSGIPYVKKRKKIYPEIQENKGRCYRFNARKLIKGSLWVYVQLKNKAGSLIKDLKIKYYDFNEFKFSLLGADQVSDELHFQQDVAIPVKTFLEDNQNRLPDGSLLKDHILYIVVCHGLPFSCEGVFGLQRGAQASFRGQGDLGSLEQRLQTLYYGWGKELVPPVVTLYMKGGKQSNHGVKNYIVTNAMRPSLLGPRWNPYMHPDTYSFRGKKKKLESIDLLPLAEKRKQLPPYFFAYGVSRIDGDQPEEAKRQVDYALYASRFLRPEMDLRVRNKKKSRPVKLADKIKSVDTKGLWGVRELSELGFWKNKPRQSRTIPFLKRPLQDCFPTDELKVKNKSTMGYYPGGADRTVVSSNGWNMGKGSEIWKQIKRGVTISACGGPAYGGGPHITNVTFWDNRILQHYLFRGRDLGECFLLSTCYVNWATSLVGDPLYHPDLRKTRMDVTAPTVLSKNDVKIELTPAMGKIAGMLSVSLASTNTNPEVAKMQVRYYPTGQEDNAMESFDSMYSTRPKVILRNLEPDTTYICKLLLIDPYGNKSNLEDKIGKLKFRTGKGYQSERIEQQAKKIKKKWVLDLKFPKKFVNAGTIEVEFTALEKGVMAGVTSKEITVTGLRKFSRRPFKIGGQSWGTVDKSPLEKGEKAVMILRWRKFPLTRELLLRAKNGREFSLVADVTTPWKEMKLKAPITISDINRRVEIHSARIYSDAFPASRNACQISVPPIDVEQWKLANKGF